MIWVISVVCLLIVFMVIVTLVLDESGKWKG